MVAVAIAALVVAWLILSHSSRRVEEIVATVEATTTHQQADPQATPDRTAMIRMPDGRLIQARIVTQRPVQAGQQARIIVIEDALSGRRSYELIDVVTAE